MVNPERAKTANDILPLIERWEERVQRLPSDKRPYQDMQMALLSRMCTKRMQEYVELHLNHMSTYAELKEEIIRLVDSGFMGKTTTTKDDGGQRPMELDPFNEWDDWGGYEGLNMVKGKGKGAGGYGGYGGKGGGKGGDKGKGKGKTGGPGWWGKGGGKNGGAGGQEGDKGKGKGKPTEFQGYCSYCGAWGHTQRYCQVKGRDWWGTSGGVPVKQVDEEEKEET